MYRVNDTPLILVLHFPRNDRHTDTLTNLDFYQLTVSVQLAIYNAVVLVWREKVSTTTLSSAVSCSVLSTLLRW